MFKTKLTAALLAVMAVATSAQAQSPTRIEQFKAWGSYFYQGANGKVCYVLSVPVKKLPEKVDHGDIFFLVSQRPGQNISYEPQAMMSYELQANSKVTIKIDERAFSMFVKGKSAWLENAAEEPALVASMKSGKQMVVSATSKRGTGTSYEYSLSGISAALKKIEGCK
ncbi:invasion associated locus B family protein [Rhizobium alvei]|uniref:Invasion associated locus B family protein n=1 Tax=Rhizobium alvei TaxID=1132659 RepID=A0ABT8YME0_9HYPH|nr:invasion associated locus B family protein [Rhizobium alvei]MDO6964857.1 invasion associated locus B family protein [Rhizobium alvei]